MADQTFTIPGSDTATLRQIDNESGQWASLSNDIIFKANQSAVEMLMIPNVADYAEQKLLVGKPTMQKLGLNLQEIELTVKFHSFVTPFKKLKAALLSATANGTILEWVWGTGEVVGSFVIVKFREKLRKTDETGLIFASDVELTLKEYSPPSVADSTAAAAQKSAFANQQLGSQTFTIPGSDTAVGKIISVDSVSEDVTEVDTMNDAVQDNFSKLETTQISMGNFRRTTLPFLSIMVSGSISINVGIDIAGNIKNGAALASASASVNFHASAMAAGLDASVTMPQISVLAANLNNAVAEMNIQAQPSQVVFSWHTSINL